MSVRFIQAKRRSVWRTKSLRLKTKMLLCRSLIVNVLLYGLEGRTITKGALTRLERAQNRMIRRIIGRPAYGPTAPSNAVSRTAADQPSIASQLSYRWLSLLQRILTGGANTAAARAALFGAPPWETGGNMTPRLKLLKQDV